jgi:hypothetical protein
LEKNDGSPEGNNAINGGRAANRAKFKVIKRFVTFRPGDTLNNTGKQAHDEQY